MRKGLHTFLAAVLALGTTGLALASSTDQSTQTVNSNARQEQRLSSQVRHELNMIPQFTVFDNLAYRVDGSTVTLVGQVRDAIVINERADAGGGVVRSICRTIVVIQHSAVGIGHTHRADRVGRPVREGVLHFRGAGHVHGP